MRILVVSDSHGNIVTLKNTMGFAKKIKIGAIIHAGDWNTIESVETVLSFGIPLYAVLGNADIDPEIGKRLKAKGKKFVEDFLEFKIDGRTVGVTHKPSDIKKYFGGCKLDIIFCGHSHSKNESVVSGVRVVRPGAIINGNNFVVYDTTTNGVEFIEDE